MEPVGLMPHSKWNSKNPYLEPDQSHSINSLGLANFTERDEDEAASIGNVFVFEIFLSVF